MVLTRLLRKIFRSRTVKEIWSEVHVLRWIRIGLNVVAGPHGVVDNLMDKWAEDVSLLSLPKEDRQGS